MTLATCAIRLSFISGGDVTQDIKADAAFEARLGLSSVRQTTDLAQKIFKTWAERPTSERRREDLLNVLGGDFFQLLDGLTIARSRAHIARHYGEEVDRLGGFPKRITPQSVFPSIDLEDETFSFENLDTRISRLTLALYNPTGYLRDDLNEKVREEYHQEVVNGFTQAGRERILIGMMKVNLLKRLESSIESFRLTLERTIEKINVLLEKFDTFDVHRQLYPEIDYTEIALRDLDDPELEDGDFCHWRQAPLSLRAHRHFQMARPYRTGPARTSRIDSTCRKGDPRARCQGRRALETHKGQAQ